MPHMREELSQGDPILPSRDLRICEQDGLRQTQRGRKEILQGLAHYDQAHDQIASVEGDDESADQETWRDETLEASGRELGQAASWR